MSNFNDKIFLNTILVVISILVGYLLYPLRSFAFFFTTFIVIAIFVTQYNWKHKLNLYREKWIFIRDLVIFLFLSVVFLLLYHGHIIYNELWDKTIYFPFLIDPDFRINILEDLSYRELVEQLGIDSLNQDEFNHSSYVYKFLLTDFIFTFLLCLNYFLLSRVIVFLYVTFIFESRSNIDGYDVHISDALLAIKLDKIEYILNILTSELNVKENDLSKDLISLNSRLIRANNDLRRGIVTSEDYTVTRNKIRFDLLNTITE